MQASERRRVRVDASFAHAQLARSRQNGGQYSTPVRGQVSMPNETQRLRAFAVRVGQ